jgi:uncharacterized protein (TIGR02996 family)
MNDELALLAALHENPDDETTWLVLSDLLEERGQERRAEWIRLFRALRAMGDGERQAAEAEVQARLLAGVRPVAPVRVNSIGMELALIPPGSFWLGSPQNEDGRYDDEGPRRLVRITRPFYLGVYPVTQAQYEAVMEVNPSAFRARGEQAAAVAGVDTSRHPVERVNWLEAMTFCRTLTRLPEEKKAGRIYRLPTEAQWEYACRGGAALFSPFVFGNELTTEQANFRARPGAREALTTTPVGQYPPNGFGLYDVMGNVWEWCADWYDTEAYQHNPPADPPGPATGDRRNVRGGTYHLEARRIRSADRSSFAPEHRDSDLGFRVLCVWEPRG